MKYITNEYMPTKNSFFYESKNFYIALAPVERGFNEKEFFKERRNKYKSQVEFMNCVNYIEMERLKNANYYLYLFYIEYYYFPFAYNNTLLKNNTGTFIDFRLFDTNTGKFLGITGCEDVYSIKYTIPYSGYYFLEDFNLQKDMYDPNVYKGPDDEIFADPIYIMENGNVTDITLEERIKQYFRIHNITPKYYDESLNEFNETGITYLNFTNDTNFIVFKTSHLEKMTAFFVPNNATFDPNGRFFYLLRPRIFLFFPNYLKAIGGFLFLILLFFYLLFLTILILYDKRFTNQEGHIEFIKEETVNNLVLYYRKEKDKNKYIPNNLRNPYNHRDFRERREMGPSVYNSESNNEMNGGRNFGENLKKTTMQTRDLLDELNSSMDDQNVLDVNKEKVVKKSFFRDDIRFKKKTVEEQLKKNKSKRSTFFYNGNDNRPDNSENKRNFRYHHNYLPEEYEEEDEAREQQIQNFADIKLSFSEFLLLNIKCRTVLFNSFCIVSIFSPRWKKLSLLMTEFCLMMIYVSIFLTADENAVETAIVKMVEYAILSMLTTDFTMYLVAFFFKFSIEDQKRLLTLVISGGQLVLDKQWKIYSKKLKKRAIIGMIICGIIWLYSFYSSFGFTVVWKFQNMGYIVCFVLCFVFNFVICEFLIEFFLTVLYTQRKHNFFLRWIAEGLNKLRNYRCLSP